MGRSRVTTKINVRKRSATFACGLFVTGLLLLTINNALAQGLGSLPMTYSGRLTESSGAPKEGPIAIEATFWTAETDGTQLGQTFEFANVILNQGVFSLYFPFMASQVQDIFRDGTEPVFIEITSGGKTYPRQKFSYTPLAMRIPVDNKTLAFDTAGGQLGIKNAKTAASGSVLVSDGTGGVKWDNLSSSNLTAKTQGGSDPTADQVLTFKGGKWVAASLPASSSSGNNLTGLVGDVVATGPGSGTATLAVVAIPGTATKVTFDAKGRVTAGTTLSAIDITTALGFNPVSNVSITAGTGLSGGSVTNSGTISLANTTVTAGTYARANITVDAQGRITNAQSAPAIADADVAASANIAQSKISGLAASLAAKENAISAGTASDYFRGDKTWQPLTTETVPESGTAIYFSVARARSSLSGSTPINYSVTTGDISIAQANASTNGYLASSDWSTFNGKQNAIGYTPINKAGDTMTGSLDMASQKIANLATPAVATDAVTKAYADGKLGGRTFDVGTPNAGQVIKWDQANQKFYLDADQVGTAGSGISTLNDLTSSSQSITTSSIGSTLGVTSSGSTHTINIPMASVASVAGGLVSNADYQSFGSKVGAVAAGTGVSVATSSGTATVGLASVGTAGVYTKVTTNALGQVTSGGALGAADIPNIDASKITSGILPSANGGTGLNSAATFPTSGVVVTRDATETLSNKTLTGGTINGASSIVGSTSIHTTGSATTGVLTASTVTSQGSVTVQGNGTNANKLVLNDKDNTSYVAFKAPDTLASQLTWELPGTNGTAGQVLSTNGTGTLSWVSGVAPTGTASGDLTGNFPNPTVATVGGKTSTAIATSVNDTVAATSFSTASTIVKRDASGNFTAGTITGSLSGNATNVTGTVAIANGGTGATTASAAFDALSPLTTIGDIIYAGATGADTRLAGNQSTIKQFLSSTGTGSAANTPVWAALTASDIPAHSASLITSGVLGVANGGTGVATTTANYVLAGPTTGTGAPTFRALVAGDLPAMGGANGTAAGTAGAVPGPSATDNVKFLRGDGTWATPVASAAGSPSQIQYNSGGVLTTNANFVYSGGNVGIGTTNPPDMLVVNNNQNAWTGIDVLNANSGTSAASSVTVGSALTGGQYGYLAYFGSGYTPNGFQQPATTVLVGGNTGGLLLDAYSGPLTLYTGTTERMRINGSGNVGIGTTAPVAGLDVIANLFHIGQASGTVTTQGLYEGWNWQDSGLGRANFVNHHGLGTGGFTFDDTYGSGTTVTRLMTITGSGNVGIGTTAPTSKLEVSGLIKSTTGGFVFPDGTTQTTAATASSVAPVVVYSGIWSTAQGGTTYYRPSSWTASGTNAGRNLTNSGGYFNTSTGIFTAPVSGVYLITLTAIGVGSAVGQRYLFIEELDGTQHELADAATSSSCPNCDDFTVTYALKLNANQTHRFLRHTAGANVNEAYVSYVYLSNVAGSVDNLGDHTATKNITMGSYFLSGDGDNEGIRVTAAGNVGIGSTAPTQALDVGGKVASTNLRQMVSATNEVTTTSTTAVDIPSMSMTINGSGLPVTMIANLSGIYFAATSYALYISLVVDGSQASLCVISAAAAGNKNSCSLTAMQTLSAGSHTVKLQWYLQSAGTAGVSWGLANRSILVFE